MAEIVCKCDSCKHNKNGRCEEAVIEIIWGGRCQDFEEREESNEHL